MNAFILKKTTYRFAMDEPPKAPVTIQYVITLTIELLFRHSGNSMLEDAM
jgi:hypothetical protein